jgi:hypothetical protein
MKIRQAYDFSMCFPHELLMSFWRQGKSFLLIQSLKSRNYFLPNLKYQLDTNGWPKTLQKGTVQLSHMSYHTSVTWVWLCNFLLCKVSCCTCIFCGDTICLLTNRKMIKTVTLIDLHIVLTYDCWHCVFKIWVSHSLEITIHFYYSTHNDRSVKWIFMKLKFLI